MGTPSYSLLAMDLKGSGLGSASLSLLHNVGWNDVWCRQRCGACATRPCNVLMLQAMVTVVVARSALLRTSPQKNSIE